MKNDIKNLTLEEKFELLSGNGVWAIHDFNGKLDKVIVSDGPCGLRKMEPDENGNLLLRSYGSDLENVCFEGGDVLLNSNGKVLRNTKGHMFIRKADPFGNYPCDVFVAESKPMSYKVDIIRIDYNFLTSDGKLIRRQNFERSQTPILHEVERTYRDDSDEKLFVDRDKKIYPKAYIYDPGVIGSGFPSLFPSAAALLIENRSRIEDGLEPIVQDERPYLMEHYRRQIEIQEVQQKLTQKSQRGTISFATYVNAMRTLADEQMLTNIFGEMETPEDALIREEIESEMEESQL